MLRFIISVLRGRSDLKSRPEYIRRRQQNQLDRIVKYKFNLPGISNFHLLPWRNLSNSMNVFSPHSRTTNQTSRLRQSR